MARRVRLPVVFGPGLDRESGIMATRPGSFEDLRNVLLRESKIELRKGFAAASTLTDPGGNPIEYIVGGHALRSDKVGLVVGWQGYTGGRAYGDEVYLFLVSADGSTAQRLGTWDGSWGAPPRVIMAESNGKVFLAHDEPVATKRNPTIYYDPLDSPTDPIQELSADLDGSGLAPVHFRGVVQHRDHLWGWGFGSINESHPEYVRSSMPADPTDFRENHYSVIGAQRDPVVSCVPAGRVLKVFKETEAFEIFGYSRSTFGWQGTDERHGCLAARLAVNKSGLVVAWGAEGPRVHGAGVESSPLDQPLELEGLDPTSLVDEGDVEDAFGFYVPALQAILFVFGQRVYALTTEREGAWKWGYWELGFQPRCGFTLVAGTSVSDAPTGYPEVSSIEPAGTYADVTVEHHGHSADEVLEVWISEDGGPYALTTTVAVTVSTPQVVRVPGSGELSAADYDVSLRYRRGVLYSEQYEDPDPSAWPLISQGSFTTNIDPASITSGIWQRQDATTEFIRLTVRPAEGLIDKDVNIYRDSSLIATVTPPQTEFGDFVYDDTGITGETEHIYQVETVDTINSPLSDPDAPEAVQWAGPTPGLVGQGSFGDGIFQIVWVHDERPSWAIRYANAIIGERYELWDNWDDVAEAPGAFPVTDRFPGGFVSNLSEWQALSTQLVGDLNGQTITAGIRRKTTVDGVDDYSQFETAELFFEDLS